MKTKPLSITLYAILFIAICLLVLGILGLVTYQEVVRLEEQFHSASQLKAANEIDQAIKMVIKDIDLHTQEFATWEEVHQQLQNPVFYAHWYRHRAINRNIVCRNMSSMLRCMTPRARCWPINDAAQLPQHIENPGLTSFIRVDGGGPAGAVGDAGD